MDHEQRGADKFYLDLAARGAYRALGFVEPNPAVGCVLVKGGRIVGVGHHRAFGLKHAEVAALADCSNRGESSTGATCYVTLEPCNTFGKHPPCVDALIGAQVARVVCARRDPHAKGLGGAERLMQAGIAFELTDISPDATRLSDPFVKRVTTGLPWVIAKWAQTIDGRSATRTGESKWISCDRSRSRVHRLRARVDAILTGIGTVLADDPNLTARGGWRRRRIARRVVIDPDLEVHDGLAMMRTLGEAPITIVCTDEALSRNGMRANLLASIGVEVISMGSGGEIDLTRVLEHLSTVHEATNVLVEAGPGLTGRLVEAGLVDELHVYVAPILLADDQAKPAARGRAADLLADAVGYELARVKRIDDDVLLEYRRPAPATGLTQS